MRAEVVGSAGGRTAATGWVAKLKDKWGDLRLVACPMARIAVDDRASAEQVREHVPEILAAARAAGVSNVRLHDDGTLVVRSDDPGYQQVIGLAGRAREIIGVYVHVITDDVPAAAGARPL